MNRDHAPSTSVSRGTMDEGDVDAPRPSQVLRRGLNSLSRVLVGNTGKNSPEASKNEKHSSIFSDDSESSETLVNIYGGTLIIQSATADDLQQEYAIIKKDTSMEELALLVSRYWKLKVPEIMLTVISSSEYFDPGTESDVEDLQIGLIQAARLTNMWILTDGVNPGVPRLIGEALAQERIRGKILEKDLARSLGCRLVVMGVVAQDDLWYGEDLIRSTGLVDTAGKFVVEDKGDNNNELNADHTHFLVIDTTDQPDKEAKWNTRLMIETKLLQQVAQRHAHKSGAEVDRYKSPVVGLLVHGGPKEIDRVLWLLRKQIPVIVIKRKGYASGLLAYAYQQGMKGSDSNHLENIIKPQLMQQVEEAFPDYCQDNEAGRISCRDRILDCVKFAVQGESRYITVLDTSQHGVDQKELNKFILRALFNAQRADFQTYSKDDINRLLNLTIDWNWPDFARREIISRMDKMQIQDEIFLQALLLPEREQFVELFLSKGFMLSHFLADDRLQELFEESLNNDIFVHIVLERILIKTAKSLGKNFIEGKNCRLNTVLFYLSGLSHLVDTEQISMGALVQGEGKVEEAERKALLALIYWSVLNNRHALAKILWKRSSEPIAMALVISSIYYRMSHSYIVAVDLKNRVKGFSVDFGKLAVEMMDLVFADSSLVAFHALVNPLSDFNDLNVVDLALIGNNIFFIAHPCCQMSMRARWLGKMKLKSFSFGIFHLPDYLKIYLCLFLIFPMYFWITFNPRKRGDVNDDDDDEEELIETIEKDEEVNYESYIKKKYKGNNPYETPPVWWMCYYLWTAPVSKFWLAQLFRTGYLLLIALVVMLPYCGNLYLNVILCAWTVISMSEEVLTVIRIKKKYPTFDLFWYHAAIVGHLYISGLTGVIVLHQVKAESTLPYLRHMDYTIYKFMLALAVVWTYFRALTFVLPVSKDLGPMLVNISEITRVDSIHWLQLWMVCIISGGLAIHAVVYPAKNFSFANVFGFQLRALLAIFLTDVDDLQGDVTCSPYFDAPEVSQTCNVSSISPFIKSRLANCPYVSVAGYLTVIQHLLVTRHIFYTLMFAMYSVTTNRTKARSIEIWKFQFYKMVTEFEQRAVIPIPLTPITYPHRFFSFVSKAVLRFFVSCGLCLTLGRMFLKKPQNKAAIPYLHWKFYLAALDKKEEEKVSRLPDLLAQIEEDSAGTQFMIQRMNDRMTNVERNQHMTSFFLERILSNLEAKDSGTHTQSGQVGPVHSAARSTPYPGTGIERFPVLDKDVAWEVPFPGYNPPSFTRLVSEFPQELHVWIDPDILERMDDLDRWMAVADDQVLTSTTLPDPEFNTVQKVIMSNDREVLLNRVSFIRVEDRPIQYMVEPTGLPRNPMGRTGLTGRGNLWWWGPNHVIQCIISRWRVGYGGSSSNLVGGSQGKVLEVLVMRDTQDMCRVCLPGTWMVPDTTAYSIMCQYVVKNFLHPDDYKIGMDYTEQDMLEFFSRFAVPDLRKKRQHQFPGLGFSPFLVYQGYCDDPANTDNAWKEAEIWSFHYRTNNYFRDYFIKNDLAVWMSVSNNLPLSATEYMAVMEVLTRYTAPVN